MTQPDTVSDHLPLSPADYMILVVIAGAPMHGYALSQAVEEASVGKVRIGLGSLYRFIGRLMTAGLLEEISMQDQPPHAGKARKTYRISDLGRRVLQAETRRLREAVRLAESANVPAPEDQ
jgi:DNA-binding PadR family transcriptional regulator